MDAKAIQTMLDRLPMKELPNGNIRTCPVRLSYPFLFEKARPMEEGQAWRFMCTLMFPAKADLGLLDTGIAVAASEKWGPGWKKQRPEMPWHSADEKQDIETGEYAPGFEEGMKWLRCSSMRQPGVVDRNGALITDKNEIYGGVWALVTLRPYVPNTKIKRVTFGLQNVQKLIDDDKLGGGASRPQDDFEPIDNLDDVDAIFAANTADGGETDDALAALG